MRYTMASPWNGQICSGGEMAFSLYGYTYYTYAVNQRS